MELMDKMEAAMDKGLNKKDLLHLVEMELHKAGIKTSPQVSLNVLSTTGDSTTSFTSETVTFDASGMLHDIFNQLTEYGVEMDSHVQAMKDYQTTFKSDLQVLIETQKKNMEQKWEEYSIKTQKQTQTLLEGFIESQSKAQNQQDSHFHQEILQSLGKIQDDLEEHLFISTQSLGKIQDDLEEHLFISTDAFHKETSALKKKISDLSESIETGFSMIKTNMLGLKDSTRLLDKNLQKYRQEIQQIKTSTEVPVQNSAVGDDISKKGLFPDKAPEDATIPFPVNHIDILLESFYGLPYKVFSCPNLNLPISTNWEEGSSLFKPSTLFGLSLVVMSYFFLHWNAATTGAGGQSLWKKWFK